MNKKTVIFLIVYVILLLLFKPTYTPRVYNNHIYEYKSISINGTKLQVMIRGYNSGTVLINVPGGPMISEIPYVRKYQSELEKNFVVVNYDPRGSGKSYNPFKKYDLSSEVMVEDLIELTKYIQNYLNPKSIVLMGHSYGTYIALQAAFKEPLLYDAYVGIGQVSYSKDGEIDTLNKLYTDAYAKGNLKDLGMLDRISNDVHEGKMFIPRSIIRKYGYAARGINETKDWVESLLLSAEYNWFDYIKLLISSNKYADKLLLETLNNPLPEIVSKVEIPVYFIMGKYDGLTSPTQAEKYLNDIEAPKKEFILYEKSAHFPQFEEKDRFTKFMIEEFQFE